MRTEENIVRKVLFLYPDIDDITESHREIEELVNILHLIVGKTNETIAQIFSSEIFSNLKDIPQIETQSISKVHGEKSDEQEDFRGLRLCVISYKSLDFGSYYDKRINIDDNDISHLLAIKLYPGSRKSVWGVSNNENYNAVIETGINELQNIIVSVMLDIAFYHFLDLPSELVYRKSFNNIKKDFLERCYSKDQMKKAYGGSANSRNNIRYLPISLMEMRAGRIEIASELLNTFTKFYYECIMDIVEIDVESGELSFHPKSEAYIKDPEKVKALEMDLSLQERNDIWKEYKGIIDQGLDKAVVLLLSEQARFESGHRMNRYCVESEMNVEKFINVCKECFCIAFCVQNKNDD